MMNDQEPVKLLTDALISMTKAMPFLESMHGVIPTDILDLLDQINHLSTKY